MGQLFIQDSRLLLDRDQERNDKIATLIAHVTDTKPVRLDGGEYNGFLALQLTKVPHRLFIESERKKGTILLNDSKEVPCFYQGVDTYENNALLKYLLASSLEKLRLEIIYPRFNNPDAIDNTPFSHGQHLVNSITMLCSALLGDDRYVAERKLQYFGARLFDPRKKLIAALETQLNQLRSIADSSPTWKTYVTNIAMLAGFIVLACAAGFATLPPLAAAAIVFGVKTAFTYSPFFFSPTNPGLRKYVEDVTRIKDEAPALIPAQPRSRIVH